MKFSLGWVVVLSVALSSIGAFADASGDFPGDDWETAAPASVGIDSAKLKALSDYVFTDDGNRRSDALLVIRHGKLAYEKYASGYSEKMRHISWSMAKSFTAVLIGIAEGDGLISRDMKVSEVYPYPSATEEERSRREKISLYNLLTMSAGYDWVEDYGTESPLSSDVTQMLYMYPHKDMAAYTASRPVAHAPGDSFLYSTGNMMLAMGMLKYRMTKEKYDAFPKSRLFDRIGMKNVVFEQDDSGTFAGGAYVYATARDFARFGYLLLRNGKWKDDQVVPQEWLKNIRTLSPGMSGSVKPNDTSYGLGFWLNLPQTRWRVPAPYPDAPSDLFFALGHKGQYIAVYPDQDLVIVRLAHDQDDPAMDRNAFFASAAGLVSDKIAPVALTSVAAVATPKNSEDGKTLPPPPRYEKKRTSKIYFTKLLASARAKDFCSCHFIVGQSVDFCTDLVLNGFKLIRRSVNEAKREVTFGLLPPVTAGVTSEEFGCSYLRF